MYAAALILLLAMPKQVHRHDFDKAVAGFYTNPSRENALALERERHFNRIAAYSLTAELSFLIAIVGCFGYWAFRLVKR